MLCEMLGSGEAGVFVKANKLQHDLPQRKENAQQEKEEEYCKHK